MRLDQRTIILLVVSLVVIVAVLLITNPANAPSVATSTPVPGSGPVFGEIDQTTITGISITNNDTGETTVLAKDEGGAWAITEATNSTDRATDQTAVTSALSTFATLASTERFTTENLADFGLDSPTYTLVMSAGETTYTLHIGNKAPANPRYYALVNDDSSTVYVVQQTQVDDLTDLIAAPPYVPPPTATATFTPSPNPYSEVEQTATAAVEQTATAESLQATLSATAQGESTAEATAEAAAEATEEATEEAAAALALAEATAEATEEAAEATEEVTSTPSPTRRPTNTPTPSQTPTPTNTPEPLPTAITVDSEARYANIPQRLSEEGFPQLGEPDAPIQVTLYSSFDSPDSREFHVEVFFELLDRVRAGEVQVTFVPLYGVGRISNGEGAARAAICAAQQDAFWRMSDALFERQGALRNQAFTRASLQDAVSDLGLDEAEWQECLESDLPAEALAAAQENAEAQSVEETPTLLVNGEAVSADLDSINAAIDALLEATPAP